MSELQLHAITLYLENVIKLQLITKIILIMPTSVASRVGRRNYHTAKLRMFNNTIATLDLTET